MLTSRRFIAVMFVFCATAWGAASSAAAPINLFGPKEYARTTGAPNEFSERFDNCEPQSQYQLVVDNGKPDGTQRLSSASVLLNGIEVLRPSELNQQIGRLERPITVSPSNMLSVRLASEPDGVLNARIECVANCLAVHVTSPAPGAEITVPSMSVFGAVTSGSDQVGVVINGLPAFVSGSRFAANTPARPGIEHARRGRHQCLRASNRGYARHPNADYPGSSGYVDYVSDAGARAIHDRAQQHDTS
jgi:hypothetical protein